MGTGHSKFMHLAISLTLASSPAVTVVSTDAGSTTTPSTSPVSASFLPSGEGWILTAYHCSTGSCIEVKRTENDGRSWTSLPLPSGLRTPAKSTEASYFPPVQQNIYFANESDGWIYGAASPDSAAQTNLTDDAEIWSTHDGGATWTAVTTKSLGMKFDVLSVSANRGWVYALSWLKNFTFGLWRSSISNASWQRVSTPTLYPAAGGSNMEGALLFKGANAWLLLGNDRGTTAAARQFGSGPWVNWNPPCGKVGDSFAVPVATSATTLVDVCTIGGYGGDVAPGTLHYLHQQTNWVFVSHDAGRIFVPTSRVVVDGSSEYLDQLPSLPASSGPGKILVAKSVSHGTTESDDHLYLTLDGGSTWSSVYATAPSAFGPLIQYVSFASSSLGYAIVQKTRSTSVLIISTNGGRTWHSSAT